MSDDLVTRLRQWSVYLYPQPYGAIMETAADEIEYLRKNINYGVSILEAANEREHLLEKIKTLDLQIATDFKSMDLINRESNGD